MKNNILFFTAHCDDAELWAGGSIKKFSQEYNIIVAITFFDRNRKDETISSSKILGYEPIFRTTKNIKKWYLNLLVKYKPEVIFTHSDVDSHFEHLNVYKNTLKALTKHKERKLYPKRWYMYDTYYFSNNKLEVPPLLVDITSTYKKKSKALKVHKSQNPSELMAMSKSLAITNGLKCRVKYAEAFYQFNLLGRWPIIRNKL